MNAATGAAAARGGTPPDHEKPTPPVASTWPPRRVAEWWERLAREWGMQARRPRTLLALAIPGCVSAVVVVVLGSVASGSVQQIGVGVFLRVGSTLFAAPLVALEAERYFVLPLFVALIGGSALSEESAWGTLRYVLAAPGSRLGAMVPKLAVATFLALATVVSGVGVSLVLGLLAWGAGPLVLTAAGQVAGGTGLLGHSVVLAGPHALLGVAAASGLVAASLASTFSFSFLLSALGAETTAAVAGGVGFLMASRAIANVPGFETIGSYLPTAYGVHWSDILVGAPDSPIVRLLLVQACYTVGSLSLAAWRILRLEPR